jgi:hypothetical protein
MNMGIHSKWNDRNLNRTSLTHDVLGFSRNCTPI